MLLFTIYVEDEYSARMMKIASEKLGKEMETNIKMVWQWVKNDQKMEIACDFHKYD